jgi:predicted nucleotidyltransferase
VSLFGEARASLYVADERIPTAFLACYNVPMHTAERVIATLRAHEAELRQAGLRSVSLFGSVARGETEGDSDIDLAAEFDPAARMDLLQLTALERRIAELLGSPVDLLPEPAEKSRLRDQINRDRLRAF